MNEWKFSKKLFVSTFWLYFNNMVYVIISNGNKAVLAQWIGVLVSTLWLCSISTRGNDCNIFIYYITLENY